LVAPNPKHVTDAMIAKNKLSLKKGNKTMTQDKYWFVCEKEGDKFCLADNTNSLEEAKQKAKEYALNGNTDYEYLVLEAKYHFKSNVSVITTDLSQKNKTPTEETQKDETPTEETAAVDERNTFNFFEKNILIRNGFLKPKDETPTDETPTEKTNTVEPKGKFSDLDLVMYKGERHVVLLPEFINNTVGIFNLADNDKVLFFVNYDELTLAEPTTPETT
jgi:hypothetical protein